MGYSNPHSHEDPVTSVAFSPDGKLLASGSWDGTVRLWDVKSAQEVRALSKAANGLSLRSVKWKIAFSPDGRLIAATSQMWRPVLWKVENGEEVLLQSKSDMAAASAAFSPDGKLLLSGTAEGPIVVFELDVQ